VEDTYQELAAANRDSWAVVDGEGTIEDVAVRVRSVVRERLGI